MWFWLWVLQCHPTVMMFWLLSQTFEIALTTNWTDKQTEADSPISKWNLYLIRYFVILTSVRVRKCLWALQSLQNFSCHCRAMVVFMGIIKRATVFLVSSFVLQQRPLSMLLRRHPIKIRKYGLWAGGYCSQWCSPNNIFMDKCLSMDINIFHCVKQIHWLCLYDSK